MDLTCKNTTHIWTVSSTATHSNPLYALSPGSRCLCGTHVIVILAPAPRPLKFLTTTRIDSPEAAAFAQDFPHLVTW